MLNNFAKGVAWLGFSRIVIQGYTFVFTLYIANLLSPSDYALMGIAMIMIGLMELMTEFGLGEAIVQRGNITKEEILSVFWCSTFIGLIAMASSILLSQTVENYFQKDGISDIIKVLSLVLFLKSFSIVPYKMIDRKLKFKLKAKIDMISTLLSISFSALLAFLSYGVWSLVYGQIVYSISILILSFIKEPFIPLFKFSLNNMSYMLKFGLNIIGMRLIWFFNRNFDKFIGGKYLNSLNFGYYSFGFKLTKSVQQIINYVVNIACLPIISKVQHDKEKANKIYLTFIKYTALITFPIFIGLFTLSHEIISVAFAEKWLPILPVFQISSIVTIFIMMNSVNEQLFIAIGKPHVLLRLNIFISLILALSFVFGIHWGMKGLLYSWIIAYPALFVVRTGFTIYYRKIRLYNYLISYKPAIIGTTAMVIVLYCTKYFLFQQIETINILWLIINLSAKIIIGAATYLIIIFLVDKSLITSIFSTKRTIINTTS